MGHLQRDREWVTTPRAAPTLNIEDEAETEVVLEGGGDGGTVVRLRGGGELGFDGVHRRRRFRRGGRVRQRGRLGRASLAEQSGDVFMVMA